MGSPVRGPFLWVRPGRCCQDAARALYGALKGKARRVWIFDADLAAGFDKISHSFLLEQLGGVPRQGHDRRVAKAGGSRRARGSR